MKLAILVPSLEDRIQLFDRVMRELMKQMKDAELRNELKDGTVGIISRIDNRQETTGAKRNILVQMALEKGAEYIAFVDDDDMVGPTYIQRGIEVANSGMDCGELWGQIYWSGKPGMPFHHYLGCTHAWQDDKKYHRPPNHLNFMKLDLMKDFRFEDKTFGEDMCWAMEIQKAGTFKTMYPIPEVIYHYFCGEPKHAL